MDNFKNEPIAKLEENIPYANVIIDKLNEVIDRINLISEQQEILATGLAKAQNVTKMFRPLK